MKKYYFSNSRGAEVTRHAKLMSVEQTRGGPLEDMARLMVTLADLLWAPSQR